MPSISWSAMCISVFTRHSVGKGPSSSNIKANIISKMKTCYFCFININIVTHTIRNTSTSSI